MTFKEEISKQIHHNRPAITASSVKTYASLLSSLDKKLNDGKEEMDFFTKDKKEIMDYVEKMDKPQTKKTLLSSLYILTGEDAFRELMVATCKIVNDDYSKQKMSQKQEENTISFDEVKEKVGELLDKVKRENSKENYINYLLVGLMSGVYCPPRRSEYVSVMVKNYDKEKDNYYAKGQFTFNHFKTHKKYGTQTLKLPKDLLPIMNKWLKLNDNDYLFYNVNNNNPISNSLLCKKLYKIFDDKKISVDLLRSIFLSYTYKDIPELSKINNISNEMGSSFSTALNCYVKKD